MMTHTRSKLANVIFDDSLLLAGTVAAVVWTNLNLTSYEYIHTHCTSGSTTWE